MAGGECDACWQHGPGPVRAAVELDATETTNHQSILRVVEIMAKSFNAPEHHVALALRDESDNLVTQANIAEKVASRETLK